MKSIFQLPLTILALALAAHGAIGAETNHNFARWEKEISAYERMDATNPPPQGGIEFVGSSTIARWKTLKTDFAGEPVFNRGFGGSEVLDATHFASRIVLPYAPKKIFFRSGGNDLANGKSAEEVFANFQAFVALVHSNLPGTEIYFISWNATPLRWKQHETEKALNKMVAEFAQGKAWLKYIEAYDVALDAKGDPRPELFMPDRLHFNPAGYELLVARVRPFVTLASTDGAAAGEVK